MSSELTRRLARHPSVAGLTAEQLAVLSGAGAPVGYEPGVRIFAEGAAADRFWLIETGSVALDMPVPGRGDQIIETLTGATMLGWSWLHPPYRWNFGAVARETTATMVFDAATVRRHCDADPAFGFAVLRCFVPIIGQRLHTIRLRMLDLYATPAQAGQPSPPSGALR